MKNGISAIARLDRVFRNLGLEGGATQARAMGLHVEVAKSPFLPFEASAMHNTPLRSRTSARSVVSVLTTSLALLLLSAPLTVSHGQSGGVTSEGTDSGPGGVPVGVSRVEEDWEIVVTEPSPATDSPQITVVFGPADPKSKTHAVFEVNHSTQPNYVRGGMQLQCWWGNKLVEYRNLHHPAALYHTHESVTFTTATEVGTDTITMEVINGSSKSFGAFGDEVSLRTTVNLSKANLDGFDSSFSLAHSSCGWGKNRIGKFARKAIRYYDKDGGLTAQDTTEKILHQLTP